jgi:hypothetical protein
LPDHWHLTCRRTADNSKAEFVVRFLVRHGFEDAEAELMKVMGYGVKFESCNDLGHLGASMARPPE